MAGYVGAGAGCSSAVFEVAGTGVAVVTAGAGGTALAAVEGTAAAAAVVVCTCCGTPLSRYSTSATPQGPHRAELKIETLNLQPNPNSSLFHRTCVRIRQFAVSSWLLLLWLWLLLLLLRRCSSNNSGLLLLLGGVERGVLVVPRKYKVAHCTAARCTGCTSLCRRHTPPCTWRTRPGPGWSGPRGTGASVGSKHHPFNHNNNEQCHNK